MDQGLVVMVDGRTKVLRKARPCGDDLVRGMLDHCPELVLDPVPTGERTRLLLVGRRATASATSDPGAPPLERVYVDSQGVPLLVGLQATTGARAGHDVLLRLLDRVALELPLWRGGWLRDLARTTHCHRDEAELLAHTLAWRAEPDTFWSRVDANVSRDHVRIVLVVDHLPGDLTRTVEFLDGQLSEVDVRAVEVSVYGAGPVRALVPRGTAPGSASQRARSVPPALSGLLDPAHLDGVRVAGRHRRPG
jgi:hypothetical protein